VSTAISRVTSQWEAVPRYRGEGNERSVDLPVTVAAAALVTSPLAGEGMSCIARIRHNIFHFSQRQCECHHIQREFVGRHAVLDGTSSY
jgi:hypothetical protein